MDWTLFWAVIAAIASIASVGLASIALWIQYGERQWAYPYLEFRGQTGTIGVADSAPREWHPLYEGAVSALGDVPLREVTITPDDGAHLADGDRLFQAVLRDDPMIVKTWGAPWVLITWKHRFGRQRPRRMRWNLESGELWGWRWGKFRPARREIRTLFGRRVRG